MSTKIFKPETRQQAEQLITVNQKDFSQGAFSDIPASTVPTNGVCYLKNMIDRGDELCGRTGSIVWGNYGRQIECATLPTFYEGFIHSSTTGFVTPQGKRYQFLVRSFNANDLSLGSICNIDDYLVLSNGQSELVLDYKSEFRINPATGEPETFSYITTMVNNYTANYGDMVSGSFRHQVNAIHYHNTYKRFLLHIGEDVYVSDDSVISNWVKCYCESAISPSNEKSCFDQIKDNVILFNSNGIYKFDITKDPIIFYKINSLIPQNKLVENNNDHVGYCRRYLYGMSKIDGDGNRISGTILTDSGSNLYDSNYIDYAQYWKDYPIDSSNGNIISGLFIPSDVETNWPYSTIQETHWTHYSLWGTADVGPNGTDPINGVGNNTEQYAWINDIPIATSFSINKLASHNIATVNYGNISTTENNCYSIMVPEIFGSLQHESILIKEFINQNNIVNIVSGINCTQPHNDSLGNIIPHVFPSTSDLINFIVSLDNNAASGNTIQFQIQPLIDDAVGSISGASSASGCAMIPGNIYQYDKNYKTFSYIGNQQFSYDGEAEVEYINSTPTVKVYGIGGNYFNPSGYIEQLMFRSKADLTSFLFSYNSNVDPNSFYYYISAYGEEHGSGVGTVGEAKFHFDYGPWVISNQVNDNIKNYELYHITKNDFYVIEDIYNYLPLNNNLLWISGNDTFYVNAFNNLAGFIGALSGCNIGYNNGSIYSVSGDQFINDDIGTTMTLSNGNRYHINMVVSGYASSIEGFNPDVSGTMCWNYIPRTYYDTLSDDLLKPRLAGFPLFQRFWTSIENPIDGIVAPGWILTVPGEKRSVEYCQVPDGYEYLAGYHHPTYQTTTCNDDVRCLGILPDKCVVYGANSTSVIPLNIMSDITDNTTGTNVTVLGGLSEIDTNIGISNRSCLSDFDNGTHIVVTSEPAIRMFDGSQYSSNMASKRIMQRLYAIGNNVNGIYSPFIGYIFYGDLYSD